MNYNFNEIISNIRSGEYKLLGFGSCRRVYDLNNGYVVKVARDIRGIDQNKAENTIYQSRNSNFYAEVAAISEDNKLLIMAKAKKISNIRAVLQYYKVKNINSLFKIDIFVEDVKAHELNGKDLLRADSWGRVNDVPVLIDYGLTRDIYLKYYRFNFLAGKRFKVIKY